MGKCSVCGNKIEYNQYSIIKGKIYCPKCTPKKVPKQAVALEKVVKESGVSLDELAAAVSTIDNGHIAKNLYDPGANPKPKKPRSKRKHKEN